jgi:predicted enzyme related to lactoylglutathione lyase
MVVASHSPGSVCTSLLRTRDIERATAFYSRLMGWTARETGAGHRFFASQGRVVASVLQVEGDSDDWVPQVLVTDVERSVADAEKLGATPIDIVNIDGVARTATVRDAEHTLFGLWQPAPHQGAELTDEVGSLWWAEVLSNNVAGARDFYSRLFGWTPLEAAFEPFASYIFLARGDHRESGILPIDPDWGIQARWNSIFAVEDCDAAVSVALRLGACEEFVHTVPSAGRIGVFADAGHAIFVVRGPVPAAEHA